MGFETVSYQKAKEQYDEYVISRTVDESILSENHLKIRQFFVKNYYELKEEGYGKYSLDLILGLRWYEYINTNKNFTSILRGNDDFWRYIAVFDIPDIIEDRFGIDVTTHFYSKNVRVYPYILYWYIYLSWQGTTEKTFEILVDGSTDLIMQVVERPGKIGINADLYRQIMLKYSLLSNGKRTKKYNGKTINVFRTIMMKNTSKMTIFRPELYPGGIESYVDMLLDGLF